jgi:large subunit ribosomal protein L22
MEYQSTQKFVRVSPTKIRPVVFLIKKMNPVQAVKVLPFIGKSASEPLMKVIMTALANARQVGVADTDLVFKEIQIGEGPRLKRGRAGSRGRVKPYKKRMSHIRVVLGL